MWVGVCARVCVHMHVLCVYVEVRRQHVGIRPLPPPCGFQGLNLGYQTWQQAFVPAEPSCQLFADTLLLCEGTASQSADLQKSRLVLNWILECLAYRAVLGLLTHF